MPLVAHQFLERCMGKAFCAAVDWGTLRVAKIAGVGPDFTGWREDVLYRVKAAGRL